MTVFWVVQKQRAIVRTYFRVEADTKEEALERMGKGAYDDVHGHTLSNWGDVEEVTVVQAPPRNVYSDQDWN